ncbi:M48 family metalloprotease [Cognatishimia activa]|uniref:M48 family metalloprotease n=1 Tax=Cognatishimia activa TaxID=1715691 RepID=UPI00222F02C4|nr:M48 family metalloprotease [Cognatishimia activa]UZD89826.1 M48 family metalloprotease [Cognatishimia activa]
MKSIALAGLCASVLLAGCVETTGSAPVATSTSAPATLSANDPAVTRFNRVVARMEGVAEQACRDRVRSGVDCDFKIVLDTDPRQPSNAYQSLDRNNRPVLTFTTALLKEMQNDHELAFVLGHEAAHHIAGHLGEMRQTATLGAVVGGGLAVLLGGGQSAVDLGTNLGGTVGARAYSKEHELEADALGARITHNAGYDPVLGAAFFDRIPDPGDRFLGSHPPNAERKATVRRAAANF